MVQILENNPTFAQQLGAQLGKAGGTVAQQLAEDVMLKRKGVDVSGLTGYARDVAIKEGLKRAALVQQGRATLAPQGAIGTAPIPGTQPEKGALGEPATPPTSRQQTRPAVEQVQQTGGSKIVIPPEQMEREATRRAHAKLNRGVPTDLQTELGLIQQENANVAQYQAYEKQMGAEAEKQIQTVMENNADPVQVANFRRKGEQYARQGLTQAQIDKNLALDARQYRDQLDSLKDIQGARLRHKIYQKAVGTSRSDQAREQSIKVAVKPFLDRGEYDVVRRELSNKGYGPEESEKLISDLSEQTKKGLSDFVSPTPAKPELYKYKYEKGKKVALSPTEDPSYRTYRNDPEGQKVFGQNLEKTITSDPNANLILLRKAYEDKGVDWDTFRNELDKLIIDGKFQPTEEQRKMMDHLEEPPLDRLQGLWSEFSPWGKGR